MSDLIIRAATLAADLHSQQRRKASLVPGVPYFSHLMEVAGMVQGAGGSDEAVAAALLHDVLEDTDCTTSTIAVMPDAVIELILQCTEIGTSGPIKADWQTRKDAYIAHLSQVSAQALLISVADKLQSLRGLKHCVRERGHKAYEHLVKSAPTLAERRRLTLWFNEHVLTAAQERRDALLDATGETLLVLTGIGALLADMDDIILWLYRH